MAGYRWSGKRVAELLEEMSDNQKNFRTKLSGKPVKDAYGYKVYPNGYFYIDGAYGGWKLSYRLPYCSAVTEVSPYGYCPAGKLAEYLLALGSTGLKERFTKLQKQYKASMKARLSREKSRA